jgi:hypothetical protein
MKICRKKQAKSRNEWKRITTQAKTHRDVTLTEEDNCLKVIEGINNTCNCSGEKVRYLNFHGISWEGYSPEYPTPTPQPPPHLYALLTAPAVGPCLSEIAFSANFCKRICELYTVCGRRSWSA